MTVAVGEKEKERRRREEKTGQRGRKDQANGFLLPFGIR